MSKTRPHGIRNPRQLAALTAAARQEVVDVLEQMGTVSVAELAAALGRPADGLYFHLRALTAAGLVRLAGHRSRSGRREALYRTVRPELQLGYDPRSAANRRAISRIVASMLRLANRDFRRSFHAGQIIVSGPQRELWAWRKVGRLSSAGLTRVNRVLKDLARHVSAPHGTGRLYGVTVVLTPLDHRNDGPNRPARRRRSAQAPKKA